MVFWVGAAPHLTYLPRKPTPLGIMFKTLVCALTGILLCAEIVKEKEVMQSYKYREQWGHTTATTLRLTEPYWGKKKILIADAWFGGLRCCYALLALGGIRSVMNVKVNSKGYPKKVMKEHAKKRGDTYSMKVKVEEEEIFASVHVDKAPMFLVHTAESMLQGPERKRNFLVYDKEK